MPRPATQAADYEQVTIRLPKALLARVRARASEERRPINTQIIMCLEEGEAVEARQHTTRKGTETPARSRTPS